jgi:hypothetical protein
MLAVSYKHLTSYMFDVYFSQLKNAAPIPSFVVRVQ